MSREPDKDYKSSRRDRKDEDTLKIPHKAPDTQTVGSGWIDPRPVWDREPVVYKRSPWARRAQWAMFWLLCAFLIVIGLGLCCGGCSVPATIPAWGDDPEYKYDVMRTDQRQPQPIHEVAPCQLQQPR